MNVFVDYHHGALYNSLSRLFEGRLGGNLFRPIGLDWARFGFWRYSSNPATMEQYLNIRENVDVCDEKGERYLCPDSAHDMIHQALTFDQFLKMPIDIVIASVANHEASFYDLVQKFKPEAKLVRQIGNINDAVNASLYRNVMASAKLDLSNVNQADLNVVIYHPEFDLDLFSFQTPSSKLQITNLMNCIPHSQDFPLWAEYKEALPEFEWRMHGILGDDGILDSVAKVAHAIRESTFIWHLKWGGDGFGYVIHHAFACGRPPIVKASYYEGKLAGELMIPGETCIDLDSYTSTGAATQAIREWASPGNHLKMCEAAAKRFREVVDYDKEEQEIRSWLDRLL